MEVNNMCYKEKLEEMYRKEYSCDGKCICFSKCSKDIPNGAEINCSRLKIGENYDNPEHPKIMFVGKEGVSKCYEIGAPAKVSEVHNPHYVGTFHTLAYILDKINCKDFVNESIINEEHLKQFDDLSSEFCLTNYFKCAFKKNLESSNHNVATNKEMEKYCPHILTNEINILRPDIIIVQGKFSTSDFWGNKNGTLETVCEHTETLYKSDDYNISVDKYHYLDNGKNLYIIWGYHPCAYGRIWFKSLDRFKEAINKVKDDYKKSIQIC